MKKNILPYPSKLLILLLIAVLFIPFFLLFFFFPLVDSFILAVSAAVYLAFCALLLYFVHKYYSNKVNYYQSRLLVLKQKFIPGYNQFKDDEIL